MGSRGTGIFFVFCLSLFLLYFSSVEVPVLGLEADDGSIKNRYIVPLGFSFETGYVHSLELTQVEDLYVPADGFIWLWEERVKSHNAGLPTEPWANGFFLSDRDWMRFFGGRQKNRTYAIRIGNPILGRNVIRFKRKGKWLNLYEICPGRRLLLTLDKYPLLPAWIDTLRPQAVLR